MINRMEQLTLKDLRTSFDSKKKTIREIPKDQLNILWIDDYYDGMLSGILEYEGQKFRFEIITDYTRNIFPRIFGVIQLTEKEFEQEAYWHELFKKHVADYKNKVYKHTSEHYLFFDEKAKRTDPRYDESTVTAWFIA